MGFYFASPIKQWACFLVLRCPLPLAFQVCLALFFSAVSQASPPPSRDVHFCRVLGTEDMCARDSIYAAAKQALNLNVGEPRTVRMIYFLPNDRPFQQAVVDSMKVTIRQIQTFYADQMEAHGYGNKTFRFETDAQGEPVVHRVDGQHPADHYHLRTTPIQAEIRQKFDLSANIYLVVIDNGTGYVSRGDDLVAVGIAFTSNNVNHALVSDRFHWALVAHELGHTFGLAHDFRDDAYIMSYGSERDRLSACSAEFLAVHPYFNPDTPTEEGQPPGIELLSPTGYPPGSTKVSVQLKISDLSGLHQVILFVRPLLSRRYGSAVEVKTCRGLAGKKDAVVEFEYDGVIPSGGVRNFSDFTQHSIRVEVVDTEGNVSGRSFDLWEIPSHYIATLEGHTSAIQSLSFSPDGTILASGSEDSTVVLWNVATRTNIATLEGHTRFVKSVSFSPDGTILASGGSSGTILLWDVATRTNIATLKHPGRLTSVAFSPDGTILASGGAEETIKLWDVATRTNIATLEWHTYRISSLSFSPDGTMLASGAEGNAVGLWDISTRKNIATLEGHMGWIQSVSFSPDGTLLASGSNDETVVLWDVATRTRIATLEGHGFGIRSVSFSPDGTMLASGAGNHIVKLWDVATGHNIATLVKAGGFSVSFSPDGMILASTGGNTITLWDMSEWVQPRPVTLEKISGDNQRGTPGAELANPLIVEVRDQYGSVFEGAEVTFTVTGGEGRLRGRFTTENAITDANGRTQSTLTPGPGTNIVEVSVVGIKETFNAEGIETPISPVTGGNYQTWHLPDGAIVRLGKGDIGEGDRTVAFSPDGQRFAVAGGIGVWVYDVAASRELALLTGHKTEVRSVSFSPDSRTLASGGNDHKVKLWDVATGENIATLEGHTSNVTSVSFSPDGKMLASGAEDNTIKLWDVATRTNTATLEGHTSNVTSVSFSPDGKMLASGAWDNTVKLWNVATKTNIATLEGHTGHIYSVAFSPDGAILASGSFDKTVRLWDVNTRINTATLAHTSSVTSVAYSPDGTTLASTSSERVRLWDVKRKIPIATLAHTGRVTSVAYSPDGTTLVAGATDGTNLWDLSTQNLATLRHTYYISSVAYSPDGTTLAVGSTLWDVATRTNITTLTRGSVRFVVFSPDGTTFCSGASWKVRLWDAATVETITYLEGHTGRVTSVAYSPDGTTLASGSHDNTIKLWDIATQINIATFEGHTGWVTSVAYSPDGTTLASGSDDNHSAKLNDNTVKLWDIATRTNIATFEGHKYGVSSVSYSPDGAILASGSEDGTVKLWNLATRTNIATFEGHKYGVTSVSFSPDGTILASGSRDKTVKLWDVGTGQNIATFEGHTRWVSSVSYSPDGTILASGSGDGTALLWDMSAYVSPVVITPVVTIPDANLRAVIQDALGKSRFAPITSD